MLPVDHPLYLADKAANWSTSRYVDEVFLPQSRELNSKYQPDLIWSDGDWEQPSSYWKSPELLAWLCQQPPRQAIFCPFVEPWSSDWLVL